MRVLSITLLAFIATTLIGAGLLIGLPGSFAVRALWMTIFVPVLWAALMFYCYWDKKRWRVVVSLVALSITGGGAVLLMPTPA